MTKYKLVNIGQLATYNSTSNSFESLNDQEILVNGDSIQNVGKNLDYDVEELDCRNKLVIPGFVDPHTHHVFLNGREEEFGQRMQGATYLEIAEQGGGIVSSINGVRNASVDDLVEVVTNRMDRFLKLGTTTIEAKSGYGLNLESELKSLEVINIVNKSHPIDIVPTFLGAHAVPRKYKGRTDRYVDLLIDEMLPQVREQGVARYCDVFCEAGVFSLEQSRRILQAALQMKLGIKIHADEVNDLGGAGLAAELKATSADHLLASSEKNLKKMADRGVVAVLLPATAYSLRKPYAQARNMIGMGLPVALATDCNPGSSYTESMPFVIGLAIINMLLTPGEALVGATLNAAYAIGLSHTVGSLDEGKQADFCLLDGETPSILAYHAGVSPVTAVYKRGQRIF